MIPASIEPAIAEILADDGSSLGTGFLVAAGVVLTAKHVVDGYPRVSVSFSGHTAMPSTTITLGTGDWAIVEIPAPDIAPMPLGKVRSVAKDVSWHTVGYPAIRAGRGGLGGRVRREAPTYLELACEELRDKTYGDARGLSGAPCVIDGVAVAIITEVIRLDAGEADEGLQRIINAEVHATPLSEIAKHTDRFIVTGTTRLPWEDVFEGALMDLSEPDAMTAAEHAKLANFAFGDRFAEQIARRMLNEGIFTIVGVLEQIRSAIPDRRVEELVFAAKSLWVPDLAANQLAKAITTRSAVHLPASSEYAAKHHAARAFTSRFRGPKPWAYVIVELEEPFAMVVVDRTREALFQKLHITDPDLLGERLQRTPVVAFLATIPDPGIVAKLATVFPDLCVVFLARALPMAPSMFEMIAPVTSDAQEVKIRQRDDALLHDLSTQGS